MQHWIWLLRQGYMKRSRAYRLVETLQNQAPAHLYVERRDDGRELPQVCFSPDSWWGRLVLVPEDLRWWKQSKRELAGALLDGWVHQDDVSTLPDWACEMIAEQDQELDLTDGCSLVCTAAESSYGFPVLRGPGGTILGLASTVLEDGEEKPAWRVAVSKMPDPEAAEKLTELCLANPPALHPYLFFKELF